MVQAKLVDPEMEGEDSPSAGPAASEIGFASALGFRGFVCRWRRSRASFTQDPHPSYTRLGPVEVAKQIV